MKTKKITIDASKTEALVKMLASSENEKLAMYKSILGGLKEPVYTPTPNYPDTVYKRS